MIPVQSYTFTIPANGSFPLQCNGRYFRVNAASGTLKVIGDTFGGVGTINPGQGLRLRDKDPLFSRLTFIDTSGAANNVTLVVADADFVDATLLGTVSVIDGELTLAISGQGFMGFASQVAAAAQFGYLELWNPAASGKRAVVSDVMFSSPGAAGVATYSLRRTTALVAAAAGAASKSSAGAASSSRCGGGLIGALPGTAIEQTTLLPNTPFQRVFKQPLVLEPGSGIVIASATVNVDVYASVQFTERAIT